MNTNGPQSPLMNAVPYVPRGAHVVYDGPHAHLEDDPAMQVTNDNVYGALMFNVQQLLGGDEQVEEANREFYAVLEGLTGNDALDVEEAGNAMAGAYLRAAFRLGVAFGRDPFKMILPEVM